MPNNTDIIAFFSSENFFRVKSEEKRALRFEELKPVFEVAFSEALPENAMAILVEYEQEQQARKAAKAKAKLEKEANKPLVAGQNKATDHIVTKPKGRYVLSVAQNNTKPDATFLKALEVFAADMKAEILLAEMLYNKGAFAQPAADYTGDDVWFDKALQPYLTKGHIDLGGVHFIADANVIPTAKNPANGFEGAAPAGVTTIVPGSKLTMHVVAALKGGTPKILASTGAVTQRNYILRKAGTVASFEHSIAAIFVDTKSNTVAFLEQVEGFDGFYYGKTKYSSTGIEDNAKVVGYQPGDIHAEKMTKENLTALSKRVSYYDPERLFIHDVLDFSSRNHHNIKDPVFMFAQSVNENTVENDLKQVANVLETLSDSFNGSIDVIESNHDLAINTWLKTSDFKIDPINALTYLKCMTALYSHIQATGRGGFNMLKYALCEIGGMKVDKINFHETDESVICAGIEMGNHGHNGANGSRGSPQQFRKLGIKMNTGHTHAPSIWGGVWTAGVSASLEMGYNIGASSWMLADIVTYENGQRQIIFA